MYLRQMKNDDLCILLDMAHAEGWSSDIFEFELYHKLNPGGCFTCIIDKNVVGGIMTFTYLSSGWIGNLIVDKKYRLKGFGKALFRKGLRHLSSLPTVFLCASPMAVGLYSEFGFRKVSNISCIRQEIKRIQKGLGITTVLVTHDMAEAKEMGDRIVAINGGEIHEVADFQRMYRYDPDYLPHLQNCTGCAIDCYCKR